MKTTKPDSAPIKAPFPYFGGKSRIAALVWDALGQPKHYIEPFFGSGAVLLARPDYNPLLLETVCDKDGFVANVWRAISAAPDSVAHYCDWPVNHADLSARKKHLLANEPQLLENLISNVKYYDAELAGYWIWAASCWIGSGLTSPGARPKISVYGKGVHSLGAMGQIPQISVYGKGVHSLGAMVAGLQRAPADSADVIVKTPRIYEWFRELSYRLRRVRVVCGDWKRVCGGNWQTNTGGCGMFLDPPYGVTTRATKVYHCDSTTVAADASAYALAHGADPKFRIVLAGYYEEHEYLLSHGWTVHRWKATGGYSSCSKSGEQSQGQKNRFKESLFFSPHCIK